MNLNGSVFLTLMDRKQNLTKYPWPHFLKNNNQAICVHLCDCINHSTTHGHGLMKGDCKQIRANSAQELKNTPYSYLLYFTATCQPQKVKVNTRV